MQMCERICEKTSEIDGIRCVDSICNSVNIKARQKVAHYTRTTIKLIRSNRSWAVEQPRKCWLLCFWLYCVNADRKMLCSGSFHSLALSISFTLHSTRRFRQQQRRASGRARNEYRHMSENDYIFWFNMIVCGIPLRNERGWQRNGAYTGAQPRENITLIKAEAFIYILPWNASAGTRRRTGQNGIYDVSILNLPCAYLLVRICATRWA